MGKGARCKVSRPVRAAGVGRRNSGPEARVVTDAAIEDSDMERRGWRERVGTVLLWCARTQAVLQRFTDAAMEDSDMERRGWRERVGTGLL